MLATTLLGKPPQSVDWPKTVTFTIDRHPGWMGGDEAGEDFNLRCIFENRSKKAVTLLLADHNDYSGTMPYPVGLKARVIDTEGNVLTHTSDFGDWWTWHYMSSDGYREMPGDRITLKPGQKVVRIVPLAMVLRGLVHLERGLRAGEYAVELKIGEITSNQMKIKVLAAK